MSLSELLPSLQSLSRAEKLQVMRFLVSDLGEGDQGPTINADLDYPIWSPINASDAASILLRELATDRGVE